MSKIRILVYGKHPEILQTVLRLINEKEDWYGEGSTSEERIIEMFLQNNYNLLLLGGGIPESSEKKLRILLGKIKPQLQIVQHYGGGSGLLYNEIEVALEDSTKNNQVKILDNPFE